MDFVTDGVTPIFICYGTCFTKQVPFYLINALKEVLKTTLFYCIINNDMKFKIHFLISRASPGQTLIEVMIALFIGAILITAASFTIVSMLQTGVTVDYQQIATNAQAGLMNKVKSFAEAGWRNIYDLEKGPENHYYFITEDDSFVAIKGKDGFIEHDFQGGLIGHWKFDEAEEDTAYDSSGFSNHGTLKNSPIRATSTCKIWGCLKFDGSNDYVELPASNDILGVPSGTVIESLTYSFWIKGRADYRRVITLFNPDDGSAFAVRIATDGSVTAFGHNPTVYKDGELIGERKVQDDTWTHIVVTFVAENGGTEIGSRVGEIGRWRGNTQYWHGKIDDVRIYNRALSSEEIKWIYESLKAKKYFYVENVCRKTEGNYSKVVSCEEPGSKEDPSTQKITTVAEWRVRGPLTRSEKTDYVTRWRNEAFWQSDWLGGPTLSDGEGVLEPDNRFVTSTRIDFGTSGSIKLDFVK